MAELLARPGREIELALRPRRRARARPRAGLRPGHLRHQPERAPVRARPAARVQGGEPGAARWCSSAGSARWRRRSRRCAPGAFDYISKPFNIGQVKATVDRALAQAARRPVGERAPSARRPPPAGLIGRTAPMLDVYKQIAHAADATVAGAHHRRERDRQGAGGPRHPRARPAGARARSWRSTAARSPRRCSSRSCSATRAAPSPAPWRTRKGLFEQAHGGTIFLDEIGEMSPALQVKLLRALEEGEVRPVGASRAMKVDVRVVAATNGDLERRVAEQRFRQDLYYRLSVVVIRVPPLRERRADIPLLVAHFLRNACARAGRPASIAPAAIAALAALRLAGQRARAREHHRAARALQPRRRIDVADLPPAMRGAAPTPGSGCSQDLPSARRGRAALPAARARAVGATARAPRRCWASIGGRSTAWPSGSASISGRTSRAASSPGGPFSRRPPPSRRRRCRSPRASCRRSASRGCPGTRACMIGVTMMRYWSQRCR